MPVDDQGNWYPKRAAPRVKSTKPKWRSLKDWQKEYDFEKGQFHPWVHYVKAIPMGEDGQVPMNHSLEVLNNIAIHLERVGFTEPDPGKRDIEYVDPPNGPLVVWNPGTWVQIGTAPSKSAATELPVIDLTGVPPEQLAVLRRAIKSEEIRLARTKEADVNAMESLDVLPKDVAEVLTTETDTPPAE